jgi:plasmid stabilization system protein ParE
MQRIWTSIERLADHPCLFAFGPHAGRREFTTEGYRVVYRVLPDTGLNETSGNVEVLRVFGSGQSRETL